MTSEPRWSRAEALSQAPPVKTWPTVKMDVLSPDDCKEFNARSDAVRHYLNGMLVREIHRLTGVPRSQLPRLVKKCLRLADDGRIWGFRALIPRLRFTGNVRKAPLRVKAQDARGGLAGALGVIRARFPSLDEELVALIRKKARHHEVHERKLRPKTLHKVFLDCLKAEGVGPQEWPFNTAYRGYRSIVTYMRDVLDEHFCESVANREEQSAKAHTATGTGKNSLIQLSEPYDAVELDAFEIPALLTVAFSTPEGTEVEKEIDRVWLLAMIDRGSNAVLAYDVVYRTEVSTDDVLRVLRRAAGEPWTPKELTIPGLKYASGSGLPSGVIAGLKGALWGCLFLDGALAHLANAVREGARQQLGFTVNYGPVGHFERRPNIENFFGQIAREVFHRYPSTTGSNPQTGRAPDAAAQAVRLKIRVGHTEEILDVKIAQFNLTESEGTSFLSPLGFLRYFTEQQSDHFIVRHAPRRTSSVCVMPGKVMCVVRGGRKSGRRPYVQLDRVHYTSPVLAQAAALIGTKVWIEFDEDDLRQICAYTSNGAELGYLRAQAKWGITKHSRKTRKAINSLVAKRIITFTEHDDPILVYLAYLSQTSMVKSDRGCTTSKRQATEAARVARESGLPLRTAAYTPTTKREEGPHILDQPTPSLIGTPGPDLRKLLSGRPMGR
jgi:putative transposase